MARSSHTLRDKLNLLPIRHERINIKVFGTTDLKILETDIVKLEIKTDVDSQLIFGHQVYLT